MRRKSFLSRLGKEWLFFDGGSGTYLETVGLPPGTPCETWNLTEPEKVSAMAEAYFRAGADIVSANTFGVNGLRYPQDAERLVREGVRLAKEGRRKAGRSDGYVALDIGPCGKMLRPLGDLGFEEAVALFAAVVKAGAEAGADLVLIETMRDTYEAKAAVLAAKENSSLPVCVSFSFDENGKLLTGADVDTAVSIFEGLRADAVGINCGTGPEEAFRLVKRMTERASVPVFACPNAGLPVLTAGKRIYSMQPKTFASHMRKIARLGVQAVGGCCGTGPEHLRAEIEAVRKIPFVPPVDKGLTTVSSSLRTTDIGTYPLVIGERLNATGNAAFQKELSEGRMDTVLSLGIRQEEAGADFIDVNVGFPGSDEKTNMREAVRSLQEVLERPVQIDSMDPEVFEAAMRIYNGKPLINHLNGMRVSMDALLPLAAKYGGVLAVQPLDENGIPKTADGRIRVARKVIREAAKYGIREKDMVFNGLGLPLEADPSLAKTAFQTLRKIRDELHRPSIIGPTNASEGLPQKKVLNMSFLAAALREGLTLAIMNSMDENMMGVLRAHLVMEEMDPGFERYLAAYGDRKPGFPEESLPPEINGSEEGTLAAAIRKGIPDAARKAVRNKLVSCPPETVADRYILPALDETAKAFEAGETYLPQLLRSAEAVQAALEELKAKGSFEIKKKKGRILLATVQYDIHDIGKNIVKVLLENYGYSVGDLGKNVSPEAVAEEAVRQDASIVGLSAFLYASIRSAERTIRLLRERKPDVKIVVGGASMSEAYAKEIGADYYAAHAMDTVRFADRVLSGRGD